MNQPDVLGLVVIGAGIAGKVRIRDIKLRESQNDSVPKVKLVGYVSRRELSIEDASQISLENALGRDDVHAVIVCTENEKHEEIARMALEAGKHVLMEFPLALSADGARYLIDLANKKRLVVYEEDISLLLATHQKLKDMIKEHGIKQLTQTLIGRPNGWSEDIDKSGSPYVSGISLLHRVVDLVGDVKPVEASLTRDSSKGYKAMAKLVSSKDSNILVELHYERGPHVERRQSSFRHTLPDGTVVNDETVQKLLPQTDSSKPGLFMQDLIQFLKTVNGERSATQGHNLTIKSLKIADELYALAKKSVI